MVWPRPCALTCQPASGRGSASRVAAISAPQRAIGCRRGRHRQRQREVGALGNADLLADQPIGACAQHLRGARRQRRLGGDRHRQQHHAVVAVIHVRTRRQQMRRGPLDRPGLDSGRQLPIERRRQSGIAGISPVGMPALLHREAQRHHDRLAGNDRRPLRDELGLDVLRLHGGGERARRERKRRQRDSHARGGAKRAGADGHRHSGDWDLRVWGEFRRERFPAPV